jgi:hypothetical protein
MRRLNLLIVLAATILVAAGSAKGNPRLGQMRLDRADVTASAPFSFPLIKSGKSVRGTILPAPLEPAADQLFVAAAAQEGGKNPPPRSTHCPPDKDDHHDSGQKGDDKKNKGNQDKEKDKDHHDDCGKGDDGKNP